MDRGAIRWQPDWPWPAAAIVWRAEIQRRELDFRHYDLDLAEIDIDRLVEQAVTVTGKAITIATMIACKPIQGSAPQ